MQFPDYLRRILSKLRQNGFEAYAVGGCVRDALLGIAPQDYDLTTSATPEQVKAALPDYRILDTGLRHGTVTALAEGHPVEITTYRTESGYRDLRHPERVVFVRDLNEDLKRRDFTINAMASDGQRLIDLFGGQEDLKQKRIRAVGDPNRRFNEDGLRILRALRFAAALGFSIEQSTETALFENRHNLTRIAAERLHVELDGLLSGRFCEPVLTRYSEILAPILPELRRDRLPAVGRAVPDPRIRLALLLDDGATAALKRLKYDNRRIVLTQTLWRYATLPMDKTAVGLAASTLDAETFDALILYLDARTGCGETLRKLREQAIVCTPAELNIDGKLLQSRWGLTGRQIGSALRALQYAVIDGRCENDPQALAAYLSAHMPPDNPK